MSAMSGAGGWMLALSALEDIVRSQRLNISSLSLTRLLERMLPRANRLT